jgi:hypothetical protein
MVDVLWMLSVWPMWHVWPVSADRPSAGTKPILQGGTVGAMAHTVKSLPAKSTTRDPG